MIYLDGFSGYGGFRHAFELEGWKFDKVYFSEIDKYAIANYKYNFPESEYAGSITDVSGLPKLDLFTFGWPCQDNSIAGKRQGQRDGTRSGLLFSAVSCIKRFKPRNFVAENVKGLQSVNGGVDIIESLKVLSYLNDSCPQYDIEMQLLNTRWFLPQNRERLFFVGHLRGSGSRKIFPIGEEHSGIIEGTTNATVVRCITAGGHSGGHHSGMTLINDNGNSHRLKENKIHPCLRSNTGAGHGNYIIDTRQKSHDNKNGKSNTRRYFEESPTLNGTMFKDMFKVKIDTTVRRLTPIECERLQGLPDNWTKLGNFNGEVKEISDSQRYKMIGNGVSIPPVREIAKRLKY